MRRAFSLLLLTARLAFFSIAQDGSSLQSSPTLGLIEKEETETEDDLFVRTSRGRACDERWASWPAVQESGVASGNVLVYKIFTSIGNLFIAMEQMIKLSLLLEVALVLDCEGFPGFRVAFNPSEINWDLDPAVIRQKADNVTQDGDSSGLHALEFGDGVLLLSDSRLLLLAYRLNLLKDSVAETATAVRGAGFTSLRKTVPKIAYGAARPDPCAWNLFLRRSPSMMQSMAVQSPWVATNGTSSRSGHDPTNYVAWHIRTSDGESARSFNSTRHKYVFHQQRAETLLPLYLAATKSGKEECPSAYPAGSDRDLPIYVSSNSKEMARNCSIGVAEQGVPSGMVDLGLSREDSHTAFSRNPNATAVSAFIDFLYLMDADIIVRSGSSFSGTVVSIKGMGCNTALAGVDVPVSGILVCLPGTCF